MPNFYQSAKFLREYKKNFPQKENPSNSSESEIRLEKQNSRKSEFLILSIIYNILYHLFQIIFLKTYNDKPSASNLTIGFFASYVTLCIICLSLKLKRCMRLNFNFLTFLSYSYICLEILIISLISYFSKENSTCISYDACLYDFNSILSGCLLILSCDFGFLHRHKIIFGSCLLSIIGLIVFRAFVNKTFLSLIYSTGLSAVLIIISFFVRRNVHFFKEKCHGLYNDNENIFDHFNSITRALRIFMFKREEIFYTNEIAREILQTAPMLSFQQMTHEYIFMKGIEPVKDNNEIKLSVSNSEINLHQSEVPFNFTQKNQNDSSLQKEAISLYENIFMFKDVSNISETVRKFNSEKFDFTGRLGNDISKKILDTKEKRLNLQSILSYFSQIDSICILDTEDFFEVGIFEFLSKLANKTCYYKILAKAHKTLSTSDGRVIEFIFENVTSHCDLLNKQEKNDLNFKKNAHEFKTPILSLLGCAEDLKSQLTAIESFLPKEEKLNINNSLDHMTNLGSYIGYLIKGLTRTSKELNSKSNLEHKQIMLNSLLNFCFGILKTLIGCNSEKLKNIEAILNNDIKDYDVSFISDDVQVKQILLNFISNSVKFTNFGAISIRAKLQKKNQNDALKISIKDTGCGVKKEDNSMLFNEYAKLNNTQNNAFGTGLGLNICKTIAENLNQKIKFKSEENKGTKVSLYISIPTINRIENFKEPNKIWKACVNQDNTLAEGILKKCSSDFGKFNSQTLIMEQNEINLNLNLLTIKKKKTTIINSSTSSFNLQNFTSDNIDSPIKFLEQNKKVKRFANSFNEQINNSVYSFTSSLSDTFDIDANNMRCTTRLPKDHRYDISIEPTKIQFDKLSKIKLKNFPKTNSKSAGNPYYHLNPITNSNPKSSLTNILNVPNDHLELKRKEANSTNPDISNLNSLRLRVLKTKRSFLKEKILIVDDQLHARRSLLFLMSKYCKDMDFNYEIIEECDGIECLRTIINNPSNIRYVFIDENMNYMNGTEAAQIIRRLSTAGKISKIDLISISADDNMITYKDLFDHCLTKPLGRENLETILKPSLIK